MTNKSINITDNVGAVLQQTLVDNGDSSFSPLVRVNAHTRSCLGCQTLSVTTGAVVTLTVPTGAVAATIQADGSAVSITLDGSTAPTATVGQRIDDGMIFYVDSALSGVKLIARSATTNVQVAYFDKA